MADGRQIHQHKDKNEVRQLGTAQRLHINRVEEYDGTKNRKKTAQRTENTQNNTDDTRPITPQPEEQKSNKSHRIQQDNFDQCRDRYLHQRL